MILWTLYSFNRKLPEWLLQFQYKFLTKKMTFNTVKLHSYILHPLHSSKVICSNTVQLYSYMLHPLHTSTVTCFNTVQLHSHMFQHCTLQSYELHHFTYPQPFVAIFHSYILPPFYSSREVYYNTAQLYSNVLLC